MVFKSNKITFYILAFAEGATVLALEICGGRMTGIYFGNSLQVWSLVIGLTIGGLAGGYWLGGFLSKKYPPEKTVFIVFIILALLTAILPGWGDLIMKMTMILGYSTGSFISVLLTVFPAMMLAGTVCPLIIHLLNEPNAGNPGKTTGTVFALSTAGGIISSLVTGYYLVPSIGVRSICYLFALFTAIIPFFYFLRRRLSVSIILAASILLFIFIGMIHPRHKSHLKIQHISDGLMGQMMVVDDINTQRRSMLVNSVSQSYMHIPSGRSQWRYVYRLALYLSYKPAGSRVLICGIGGGNLVNEMQRLGFSVDGVDIDPRTGFLSRAYFGVSDSSRIIIDDARHFINTCINKYDIIIIDLSLGETQPSNIYTFECFRTINALLRPDGIVCVHYLNTLSGENSIAVKSIGNTLVNTGFVTRLLNTDRITPDGQKANWDIPAEVIFFASLEPVDLNGFDFARRDTFVDPFHFPVKGNIFIENYDFSDGMILTDDKPMMDILHANTLESTRQSSLDELIPILVRERVRLL